MATKATKISSSKTEPVKPITWGKSTDISFFKKHLYALIIFGFSILLYTNTVTNGYNMDDELVTRNHKLTSKGIGAIGEILTSPYYSDNQGYAYEYRPTVLITFAIENSIFGESATVSHLINILLYGCMVLVLFYTLRELFRKMEAGPLLAFLVSLLFAAHPIHTEVVASIKNRDEILALLFAGLAWLVVFRYRHMNMVVQVLLCTFLMVVALGSKYTIFVMAGIIPVSMVILLPGSTLRATLLAALLGVPLMLFNISSSIGMKVGLLFFPLGLTMLALGALHMAAIGRYVGGAASSSFKVLLPAGTVTDNKDPSVRISTRANIFWSSVFLLVSLAAFVAAAWFYLHPGTNRHFMGYALLSASAFAALAAYTGTGYLHVAGLLTMQLGVGLFEYIAAADVSFLQAINVLLLVAIYHRDKSYKPFKLGLIAIATLIGISFLKIGIIIFIVFDIVYLFFPNLKWKGKWNFVLLIPPLVLSIAGIKSLGEGPEQFMRNFSMVAAFLFVQFIELKPKWHRLLLLFWIIVPLTFAILLGRGYLNEKAYITQQFKQAEKLRLATPAPKDSISVAPVKLPAIIDFKTDRPLDFVEVPVNMNAPLGDRVALGSYILLRYMKLAVLPYPMSFYYGYKEVEPVRLNDIRVIISLLIYGLLALVMLFCFYRKSYVLFFGLFIYLLSLAPYTGIFHSIAGLMADRFLLVPSLGFCILLGWGLFKVFKLQQVKTLREIMPAPRYTVLALLLLYSIGTIGRNNTWQSDLKLMRNDVPHVDQSAQAHNLLAVHLMQMAFASKDTREQLDLRNEALGHFKKAITIRHDFYNATFDLARTYLLLSDLQPNQQLMRAYRDSSLETFKRVIAIDSANTDPYIIIGELYMDKNEINEAIPYFAHVANVRPNEYVGYDKLGLSYYKLKQYDKSIAVCHRAIEKMPTLPDPYINLTTTYITMGQRDSALVYLQKAKALSPANNVIQNLEKQLGLR